jgi:enoyl reductase-like protein
VVVLRCARCDKDLDVPALKFDTLDYVKQLTSAGVEAQVAEIHAMTMKQAFGMYIDDVITKDYLDATLDARFAEQDLRWESRFAEQDLKMEQRFAKQDLKIEQRFAAQDLKIEAHFMILRSEFKLFKWVQAALVTAVLLPQLALWVR